MRAVWTDSEKAGCLPVGCQFNRDDRPRTTLAHCTYVLAALTSHARVSKNDEGGGQLDGSPPASSRHDLAARVQAKQRRRSNSMERTPATTETDGETWQQLGHCQTVNHSKASPSHIYRRLYKSPPAQLRSPLARTTQRLNLRS